MISIIVGACKAAGVLVWISPALLRRRRQAVTIFKKQLYDQGLDQETVKELTTTYKKLGQIQSWV